MWSLYAIQFLTAVQTQGFAPALPLFMHELGESAELVGSMQAAAGVALVVGTYLWARVPPTHVVITTSVLRALAGCMHVAAHDVFGLLLSRIVYGANAGIFLLAPVWISRSIASDARPAVAARNGAAVTFGMATGPIASTSVSMLLSDPADAPGWIALVLSSLSAGIWVVGHPLPIEADAGHGCGWNAGATRYAFMLFVLNASYFGVVEAVVPVALVSDFHVALDAADVVYALMGAAVVAGSVVAVCMIDRLPLSRILAWCQAGPLLAVVLLLGWNAWALVAALCTFVLAHMVSYLTVFASFVKVAEGPEVLSVQMAGQLGRVVGPMAFGAAHECGGPRTAFGVAVMVCVVVNRAVGQWNRPVALV